MAYVYYEGDVEVDLDIFDDEEIAAEFARRDLSVNDIMKTYDNQNLMLELYEALKYNNPSKALEIQKELIYEVTGKIL